MIYEFKNNISTKQQNLMKKGILWWRLVRQFGLGLVKQAVGLVQNAVLDVSYSVKLRNILSVQSLYHYAYSIVDDDARNNHR
jgi:hypothetical protein